MNQRYFMELINESHGQVVFSIVLEPGDEIFNSAWALLGESLKQEMAKSKGGYDMFRLRAADAIINGDICEICGENLGEGAGYPRMCRRCENEVEDEKEA